MPEQEAASPPRRPSLARALVLGALLVAVDAFFLNQGALALVVGLWLLFVSLPRTFLARKFQAVRRERLTNLAVYFVAVILVFVLNAWNNSMARSRAEVLISAVKSFHARNQRYPNSLEELVPQFIDRVPLAKYTFTFNNFWYRTSAESTVLFYVEVPPFGRPTYSFTRNEWGYLD